MPGDQVEQVRRWIQNYHRVKEKLGEDLRHQPGTGAAAQEEPKKEDREEMSHTGKQLRGGASPVLQPYG